MDRAANIFALRFGRIEMHGGPAKGPLSHPSGHEKQGDKKTGEFNLLDDGKNTIRVAPLNLKETQAINRNPDTDKPKWITVWKNPTDKQLQRLVDSDDEFDVELRFMIDRETGDLIAWDSQEALHTQITKSLFQKHASIISQEGNIDLWSDYTIPASEFYESLRNLDGLGEFDQPDWSDDPKERTKKPKILGDK